METAYNMENEKTGAMHLTEDLEIYDMPFYRLFARTLSYDAMKDLGYLNLCWSPTFSFQNISVYIYCVILSLTD